MPRNKRNKLNTATQPIEDAESDGYGSPAYLKWIEENDEWLDRQINGDTPANKAALEIMRAPLGGKHEKHQNKN